jgi:hypothetical protein
VEDFFSLGTGFWESKLCFYLLAMYEILSISRARRHQLGLVSFVLFSPGKQG